MMGFGSKIRIQCHYLSSAFLGHTEAETMLNEIHNVHRM